MKDITLNQIYCISEIAKEGSISRAAEKMYMGQPNLSRILRDFEEKMGFSIFIRTAKGVDLTLKGARLLNHCHNILQSLEKMEYLCTSATDSLETCCLCVPKYSYYTLALSDFMRQQCFLYRIQFQLNECSAVKAIDLLINGKANLAVVSRSSVGNTHAFSSIEQSSFEITELRHYYQLLTMAAESTLSNSEACSLYQLDNHIQIFYDEIPILFDDAFDLPQVHFGVSNHCSLRVSDRGSAIDFLKNIPNSYMWSPPLPEQYLKQAGLVQQACLSPAIRYSDILIAKTPENLSLVEKELVYFLKNWSQKTDL